MGFLALSGIIITCAMLVTLCRVVHWRLVLGYATIIDVLATIGLLTLYAGTFSGMFSATIAGLILAVSLSIGRKLFGYTTIRWNRSFTRPEWEAVHTAGIMDDIGRKTGEKTNAYNRNYSKFEERVRYSVFGPYPRPR